MVATSAHHLVRVTVRVSVVNLHRDIDVTLPTASTLAEVLPELVRLIDVPEIHRPWQASTVGGAPLDMHTPLHKLKLFDGSVLTLHPIEPPAPPVVRDAAESLGAAAQQARDIQGLDVAAGVVGAAGFALLAHRIVPTPAALCIGALVLLVVGVVARSRGMFWPVPALGAIAAAMWVAGPRTEWLAASDPAIGVLTGALAAAVLVAVGGVLRLAGPTISAFYLTVSVLLSIGAGGAWLPAAPAPAALIVLAAVLTVMATPGAASRAAGLQIPRIPTAGEEFEASDGYQADVDARSAVAVAITQAMSCAVAVCAIPALGVLAAFGGGWVVATTLCAAGALGLYASRHHFPGARVPLMLTALAGAAASVVVVARMPEPHPALVALAIVVLLIAGTAPLWAPRVPQFEPTTVVWFERAEAAAIIAVIPLAVHLTGLFTLIRGL